MELRLNQRSLQDDAFRQQLLEDPRAAVEEELGTRLPAEVRVVAVEETAETIFLVLPSASPLSEGEELSDRELESVAGSGTWGALTPARLAMMVIPTATTLSESGALIPHGARPRRKHTLRARQER
jgi:hypothetical protein